MRIYQVLSVRVLRLAAVVLAVAAAAPAVTQEAEAEGDARPAIVLCIVRFANLSGQAKWDATGAGLAEGLAARLVGAPGIQVVERAAIQGVVEELKLQQSGLVDEGASSLGKLAGAEYTVVGSFEPAGNALRVNARVVKTEDGTVVCAITRDSANRDTLEATLAAEIAKGLGSRLAGPAPAAGGAGAGVPTAADEAAALFETGKYWDAFQAYCRASDASLDDLELHRRAERCARLAGVGKELLERYTRLVAEHPKSAVLRNYLGNALLLTDPMDRAGSAREHYQEALKLDPALALPLNNLGVLSYRQGDRAQAESWFKRYLKACPEDAPGWVNVGLLHVGKVEANRGDKGAARDADDALRRASRLQPGLPSAHKALGRLYAALGRKQEALSAFQTSLTLNDKQADVRQHVERLQGELGGAAPAAPVADDMETRANLRRGQTAALAARVAEALKAKQFEQAQALAQELCKLEPTNPLAFQLLGRAYEGKGLPAKAQEAFMEAGRLTGRK